MLVQAVNIPTKIKFKELIGKFKYKRILQSNYEVIFEYKRGQYIVLYSFGVCVCINLPAKVADNLLKKLQTLFPELKENILGDTYRMKIIPESKVKVMHKYTSVPEFNIEYARIVSLALAESVALEYFEYQTEKILDKSAAYSNQLQAKGSYPTNQKELLKFIGFALATRQNILSSLYLTDSPDETWENPVLDKMFLQLKDQFDLDQRYRSINLSLNSIQEGINVMIELIRSHKATVMELWIIGLITFEIVLSLVFRFLLGGE